MMKISMPDFQWHIIANPNALSKKRTAYKDFFLQQFDLHHIKYTFHVANGQCQGMQLAEKLCREGNRHFMLIGGDGTVNEIINGFYNANIDTSELYLAIIPLGTGNDFCRTHHYPFKKEAILQLILDGNFVLNDVGLVETLIENDVTSRRYFINIAGFAFDAAIIEQTVGKKPFFLPAAVYLFNLIKVLFTYKARETTIKTNETTLTDQIFTIAVGIGQYNGNGMRQVPMANANDGQFDVVIIRKVSPWKVVQNVGHLYNGTHIKSLAEAKVIRTNQLEIAALPPLIGEVEGELLTKGNYRISNMPHQINILTCPDKA